MYFKSNPLKKQTSLNVDRENGVIYNVSIAEAGVNKNGTFFSENFLKDLADGANEQGQGVKSRFGHPSMCSTSLGSYIGRYKNFRFDTDKVVADLHLDEITKKTNVEGRNITLFDYIMTMSESNPDMFGNSIHISADKFDEVEIEGAKYQSHVFGSILASDLVDDPAATSGLFSNSKDLGVLASNFLDENPKIFELFESDPKIIIDFFERYENFINFKPSKKMSFLSKLKDALTAKFDIDLTLANGEIVSVITENEAPQVGDDVKDAEGKAVSDGDLLIADGSTLVIEGGKIAEIKEVAENNSDTAEIFSKFEANLEVLAKAITNLEGKFNTLAKSVGSQKFENFDAEDLKANVKLTAYDRALAQKK